MLSKKAYLATVADRITCEADEISLFDAYQGSALLSQLTWELYERRGKAMGVPAQVAGYMLMNGVGSAEACAVFGVKKRMIG